MENDASPLKQFRLQAGISLEQLGARLSVNKSTVLRWETGKVPAERVLDIERATGVSRHALRPDIFGPGDISVPITASQEAAA